MIGIRVFLQFLLIFGVLFSVRIQSNAASGASTYQDLRGLKAVDVVIESIDANECSVTKSEVETALRYILAGSRIKMMSGPSSYLYLNVNVLDDCRAADIKLSLFVPSTIVRTQRFHETIIWEKESLIGGGSSSVAARARELISEFAKLFVVDWSAANP